MAQHISYKYFRVNKFDTSVVEVSFNDFRLQKNALAKHYFFPPDREMFYGYPELVTALEKAKAGALAHIDALIRKGDIATEELRRYRMEHYEDLWINLAEVNIQKVAQDIKNNQNYKWKPYRIQKPIC